MNALDMAIGWLAPATCVGCGVEGGSLCAGCTASSILTFGEKCYLCEAISPAGRTCPRCRSHSPCYVWISTSYEGLVTDLLRVYKFGHQRVAANAISRLMSETLQRYNLPRELEKLNYLVVPVPTATSRVRQRGFDHSQLLAKKLARGLNLEFLSGLRRLGQANQVGAKRTQRLKQQIGAYELTKPEKIHGRNILIIDDVTTTGATLRSVTENLRSSGARRVDALVFAKSL